MKYLLSIFTLSLFLFSSCSAVSSDPETEKIFEGNWECSKTEDGDDGSKVNVTETVSYDLDHTFHVTFSIDLVPPEYGADPVHLMDITATGKWRASKKELYEETDAESLRFFPSEDMDETAAAEMKAEFRLHSLKFLNFRAADFRGIFFYL